LRAAACEQSTLHRQQGPHAQRHRPAECTQGTTDRLCGQECTADQRPPQNLQPPRGKAYQTPQNLFKRFVLCRRRQSTHSHFIRLLASHPDRYDSVATTHSTAADTPQKMLPQRAAAISRSRTARVLATTQPGKHTAHRSGLGDCFLAHQHPSQAPHNIVSQAPR